MLPTPMSLHQEMTLHQETHPADVQHLAADTEVTNKLLTSELINCY